MSEKQPPVAKEKPKGTVNPAANRSGETDRGTTSSSDSTTGQRSAELPTAVRVLLEFDDYPQELIYSAYQQLLSAATSAEEGQSDRASPSGVSSVTAESLARLVEAMMKNPKAGGAAVSALSPGSESLPPSVPGRELPPDHIEDAGGGDEGGGDLKTDGNGGGELDTHSSSAGACAVADDPAKTSGAGTTTTLSTSATAGAAPTTAGLSADSDATERRRRQLQRLRALRAENRRLKRRQICRQCGQNPVDLTLLPCGHFCFCQECGSKFTECPLCLKTILADVKTFVS